MEYANYEDETLKAYAQEGCPVLPSTVQGEFGTPTGVLANPRP